MYTQEELYVEFEKLKHHRTLDEFYTHFHSFSEKMGYHQLLYTAVPSFYQLHKNNPQPIIYTTFDPRWMERYAEKRYDLNDSALKHCLSGSEEVYIWPYKSEDFRKLSPIEQKIHLEAREVGIHTGFTIPMYNALGALGIASFSFLGRESEFENFYAERIHLTEAFCFAFNESILTRQSLHYGHPHFPKLTPKELEALKWIATGYTYERVADLMNIGVSTVRKHFASVMKKLNARNGQHACALAVKWQILT